MPRRLTIHCECDRCSREWFEEYNSGEPMPEPSTFEALFDVPGAEPRTVSFGILCERCVQAVGNYFDHIAKERPKDEKEEPAASVAKKEAPNGASSVDITVD